MTANNTQAAESFAELFEQSQENLQFRPGTTIKARVIGKRPENKNPDFILVDAGLKSESWVPAKEFAHEEVNVGDEVEVVIKKTENGFGETKLSRLEARRESAWAELQELHEKRETVTGTLLERVRGGFTVDLQGILAFLPGSLVDAKLIRDTGLPVNRELEVRIIKMDKKRNNVVVSQRAVLDQISSEQRQARISQLQEGQQLKGVVKNITDYGAFVDLGGIDGLLHITDMSWNRIKNPQEVIQVGQEIDVKILKFDMEKNRISLGIKQLGEDPWVNIERRYPVNTRVYGTVTNVTDYGCFVQIENGVEGLVHMSEMDWTNRNVNPSKVVEVGQEIEVIVLDISEQRRRISLGIKQIKTNPWVEFASTHKKGDKITCAVRSITDFGMFLGLPGEIDGLVHLSDISWNEAGEQAVRRYKKGDEVTAVIMSIDSDRERISLSVKQLEDNPFGEFIDAQADNPISATVNEVEAKQAVLQLNERFTGLLRHGDYRDAPEDLTQVLKSGDAITVTIHHFDAKNQMIYVSNQPTKSTPKSSDAKASIKKADETRKPSGGNKGKSTSASSVAKATLGDLLKEQMKGKK